MALTPVRIIPPTFCHAGTRIWFWMGDEYLGLVIQYHVLVGFLRADPRLRGCGLSANQPAEYGEDRMPLSMGVVTARVWSVIDPLPSGFKEQFERNLKRHAFRDIDPDKAEMQSLGWVNIRQLLDNRLNLDKVLYGGLIVLALRIDKLVINQKVFRARLAEETAGILREKKGGNLSREERLLVEDRVRMGLIRNTQPTTAVYEASWDLQKGVVFFGTTSERMNLAFSDLFTETFQVSLEPRFPYMRASRWARKQGLEPELVELLPTPFSPAAPAVTNSPQPDPGHESDLKSKEI